MNEQNKQEKQKPSEELRNAVAKIIQEGFIEMKKKEMEVFVMSLDPLMTKVDEVVEKGEEENRELKLNMFRHKIALISFNGILLALMVGSKDKISFGLFTFSLLFFSIVIGLLQVIIYYFKNEYSYIDGIILRKKMKAVSELCKQKRNDENIINDAKSFLRNIKLDYQKSFDSVPALLKDMDKSYNLTKIFFKSFLYEILFYIPFVAGVGLVIYKLYFYVK